MKTNLDYRTSGNIKEWIVSCLLNKESCLIFGFSFIFISFYVIVKLELL